MANVIGSLLLALGANLLLRREQGRSALDDTDTQLSARGSPAPMVIGTRRVSPVHNWWGDRRVKQLETDVGFSSLGSVSTGEEVSEAGTHVIHSGRFDLLQSIKVGSKTLYEGPLSRSAGSGVSINLGPPNNATAFVYFGELDQPINERLAAGSGAGTEGLGIRSRWPGFGYIEYRRIKLGGAATWPNLAYTLTTQRETTLTESPAWLGASQEGASDSGQSLAHALWALLVDPWPDGVGADPAGLEQDCFEVLGQLAADEHLPVNLRADDAPQALEVIGRLLTQFGAMMPEVAAKLAPRAVRDATQAIIDALPVIDHWPIEGKPQAGERHRPFEANTAPYTFPDRDLDFRDNTVGQRSDAAVRAEGRVVRRRKRLDDITDRSLAERISDLRSLDDFAPQDLIRLRASAGAARLVPGELFVLAPAGEAATVCAVVSARRDADPSASIAAAPLRLASPAAAQPAPNPDPGAGGALAPDLRFAAYELGRPFVDLDARRLGVVRIRANAVAAGSQVYGASTLPISFSLLGENPGYAFGGLLTADLPQQRPTVLEGAAAPEIDAFGGEVGDIIEAADLSDAALRQDWLTGRQVAVIGEGPDYEIAFVRALEQTQSDPPRYRLEGLISGRFDSQTSFHAAGTPVYIVGSRSSGRVTPLPLPGAWPNSAWLKSVPFSASETIDVSEVTADEAQLLARSSKPLSVLNLRANGQWHGPTYQGGQDIQLTWDYRVIDGLGSAAGEQIAGQAIGGKPTRDGAFSIVVSSGSPLTQVRLLSVASDDTRQVGATYDAATNAADHGGTPASVLEFQVTQSRGAFLSAPRRITVTKE